ncbi:MAG: amidase family protein, partial [Pseudomonadota bacterium]
LRRAGAVIVGRTNTPAFSLRWFTDNALHGRTMNPWGARLAPGGSSGGAGVAAATGMCAVASGNDYGGSVRHPAMVNGVVGLRPTTGRVAAFTESGPARPLSSQVMSVQGPLARSVADAALALDVMAGADARDPFQVPVPPVAAGPGRPARVALFRGAAAAPVAEALDRAAGALSDAGWEVVEAAPPAFDAATDLWRDLVYHDMAVYLDGPLEAAGDPAVTRNLALMAEARAVLPASEVLALYTERQRIAQAWSTFFEAHPILLTATSWRHALAIDADQESAAALEALVTDQAPMLATAVLGLPGLSVPTHLAEGAPTGVQLVSRWFREDLMVAAGQVIEAAMGRLTPIDPRH